MKRPQDSPPARGSIRADELLLFAEAARRLGWCAKSRRRAQRDGLRVITYGRCQYVRGSDLLDFFAKLAPQQIGNRSEQGGVGYE
jgi:hypothetical protein